MIASEIFGRCLVGISFTGCMVSGYLSWRDMMARKRYDFFYIMFDMFFGLIILPLMIIMATLIMCAAYFMVTGQFLLKDLGGEP